MKRPLMLTQDTVRGLGWPALETLQGKPLRQMEGARERVGSPVPEGAETGCNQGFRETPMATL